MFRIHRYLFVASLFLACFGCLAYRQPVPVGTIPELQEVQSEDEQYGHKVLSALTERYPLDTDDDRILRVRSIVQRLTEVQGNDKHIWHVYVLSDDSIKNAAATKGNYIFVWSGMLNVVDNDDELATVLAHEIAHVLAGHTQPDPAMEINEILSGIAGRTTREIIFRQGGGVGALAALADLIISETLQAALINPEKQRLELEADHIGLFLMAEAGYDPSAAIRFWERAGKDFDMNIGLPVEFLSTHPSSDERLDSLEALLDDAKARIPQKTQ